MSGKKWGHQSEWSLIFDVETTVQPKRAERLTCFLHLLSSNNFFPFFFFLYYSTFPNKNITLRIQELSLNLHILKQKNKKGILSVPEHKICFRFFTCSIKINLYMFKVFFILLKNIK